LRAELAKLAAHAVDAAEMIHTDEPLRSTDAGGFQARVLPLQPPHNLNPELINIELAARNLIDAIDKCLA